MWVRWNSTRSDHIPIYLLIRFKYVDRQKFHQNTTPWDDETLLSQVFTPAEREMAVYQILAVTALPAEVPRLFGDSEHGQLLLYLKKKAALRDLCSLRRDRVGLRELYRNAYAPTLTQFLMGLVNGTSDRYGQ
jgi:hypothetical protein